MNRKVPPVEPNRPMYHQCRLLEGQQCGSLDEKICSQATGQSKKLTPQFIVFIMGLVVALLSSLFVLVMWYFAIVSMTSAKQMNPVIDITALRTLPYILRPPPQKPPKSL